jgi:lysophospholipase L1-like esterase
VIIFFKKIIKIFIINLIIVLLFFSIIELSFGYWFDKDNFGPHMREHRMKNQRIVWENENEKVVYYYRRNYHGFRGADINPSEIDGVILGSSVIDERYKPEKYTITELLNNKLKNDDINFKFINGGVEALTTGGLVSGFKNWLLKLEDFSPKFIIFYVGINDVHIEEDIILNDLSDNQILNPDKKEVFFDNIKSRSIIIDSINKFKFKYLPRKGFVKYDGEPTKEYRDNYNFIEYEYAKKNYNYEFLKNKYRKRVDHYLFRIDLLAEYSNKINSIPIFVISIGSDGHQEIIYTLNNSLINHCMRKNYNCIDLAHKLTPSIDLWFDGAHTTKKGSNAITNIIYPDLKKIINKYN